MTVLLDLLAEEYIQRWSPVEVRCPPGDHIRLAQSLLFFYFLLVGSITIKALQARSFLDTHRPLLAIMRGLNNLVFPCKIGRQISTREKKKMEFTVYTWKSFCLVSRTEVYTCCVVLTNNTSEEKVLVGRKSETHFGLKQQYVVGMEWTVREFISFNSSQAWHDW